MITNFFFLSLVKDKAQHAVVFEKSTLEKLNKDVQTYRLITVATLVDRLKINGSLARKALADLEEQGQIKKVVSHSKLNIYSAFSINIHRHQGNQYTNLVFSSARAVAAE
jgi:small subunit ribosomal protein S25e